MKVPGKCLHKTDLFIFLTALDLLGTLHPFPQPVRVGRSFYYFSRNACRHSRRAVVSGMEVHDFIMGFLLTEELLVEDRKYIIGLEYKPEDDEFFWENGKRESCSVHYFSVRVRKVNEVF